MNPASKARIKFILSMVIFGTLALFTRHISVSSGELALYRAILAAVLVGIYLPASGQKFSPINIRTALPLLLLSGAAMGVNWILLFQAYTYTSVSAATLSYYFAPVIVTIVSPLLFHEKLTKKQLICFIMSTIGLVLIIDIRNVSDGSSNLTGILFGLGAAGFYAAVIILNKFISAVSGLYRTLLQFIAAVIVLTPYVLCTGGFHLTSLDFSGWICLFIVGLIHTGITYCIYFSSLSELKGQEVSILSYIDPLVAVLISVVFLKEPLSPSQLIGGAMILGFTLWNERGSE